MNSLKIAAALRVLALAFESDADDPQPSAPAAEPQKRGRGRPVKGEETGAAPAATVTTAPASVAAASTTATAATAAVVAEDPFATPAAAPAAPVATLDEVRKALTDLREADSQEAALAVLKTAGEADNLTSLAVAKYGVVVAAVAVKLRIIAASRPAATPVADPFAPPAAAPAEKQPTLDDVKAAVIAASKRTAQDTVAKVVMDLGGKAAKPDGGGFGPSWSALPKEKYAEAIMQIKALPTTK